VLEDGSKHFSGHRHLSQLEDNLPGMAHHAAAVLKAKLPMQMAEQLSKMLGALSKAKPFSSPALFSDTQSY
jgi:hypothetical protein